MRKNIRKNALLFLITVLTLNTYAQTISGKVVDETKNPLEYVAVALINPIDSTLASYANTDEKGIFKLMKAPEGESILQIHLLGFKTYQKIIDYKSEPIELGEIKLENDNQLDEVIVKATVPIIVKKDTIGYNAKAFKIRADDTVEDLLKKLPGVEVNAEGKVTAQGEDVTKVYVDGKEFFGKDLKVATKNLPADAIKKVEVIDEKTEQARVSGVNDFDKQKAINLVLKEDKKNNAFGKAQGGYGTKDRYLGAVNYNQFSSKIQTSIIGKYNNVNSTGSDVNNMFDLERRYVVLGGSNSVPSSFVTTGIGGVNLGYEIEKKKDLNADYFYNYSDATTGDVIANRTEFINDQEIRTEIRSRDENIRNNNEVNFNYKDRSNKLSSLEIEGEGTFSNKEKMKINTLDKYNGQNELDLQSIGSVKSESDSNDGEINFEYTQKFHEDSKRHIQASGRIGVSDESNHSINNQLNRFNVADPTETFDSNLDIEKNQDLDELGLQLGVEYIEPLSEHHFLEFIADIDSKTIDDSVVQTKAENMVDQPSLIYDQYYDQLEVSGRVFYKYDKDGLTFNAGGFLVNRNQDYGLKNEEAYNNNYTYYNPEINLRYEPKRGKRMGLNLKKYKSIRNENYLSPVVNDFDPLFVKQGNPNLKPGDDYNVRLNYSNFNQASGLSVSTSMSYNYKTNNIVNVEFTDDLGIRYSTFENSGDKNSVMFFGYISKRLKSIGLRYGIFTYGTYDEYMSIINGVNNETQSRTGNLSLNLENNKKDNIDAAIGVRFMKNYTTFSSGNNADRDFLQQTYSFKVDWNATDRFSLDNKFLYSIYSDSNFGTNQSTPIWNASLLYDITQSKSLTVMVSAFDILNKSIGLNRTSNDNYFEEVQYDVLGNYYMLSLIYNINGNKAPKGTKNRRNLRRRYGRYH